MAAWQAPDAGALEGGLRELPAPDQLLKPRDRAPVMVVPASTWTCFYCRTPGGEGAGTTVEWLTSEHDGPDGRCRDCGQQYVLADAIDGTRWWKERVDGAR